MYYYIYTDTLENGGFAVIKRFVVLCLLFIMTFSLFACNGEISVAEDTTLAAESTTKSDADTPNTDTDEKNVIEIGETYDPITFPGVRKLSDYDGMDGTISHLTWDMIEEFPIKTSDMTIAQRRQLCLDFYKFSKTAIWVASDGFSYSKKAGTTPDTLNAGTVYGGFPYVSYGSGNVYRLLDYMDADSGIIDMKVAVDIEDTESDTSIMSKTMKYFGNQCSFSAFWGWGRVVNSAQYTITEFMTVANGFIRVGTYTYDDSITSFSSGTTTKKIVNTNGEQVMYESYAKMQMSDGLVRYTTAGHTMMCSAEPVVVRNADGTIDGTKSYLKICDQTSGSWKTGSRENGLSYIYKSGVDTKKTFASLFEDYYIPFTFEEFLYEDTVEETEYAYSHSGETVSVNELNLSSVSANYAISDIYAILRDASGELVGIVPSRAAFTSTYKLDFSLCADIFEWEKYENKNYTVEIVAQLSTGERPLVYRGTLAS